MSLTKTTPIIFLHGFLGSKEDWKGVAVYLKKGFPSYFVSLPGHDNHSIDKEDNMFFPFFKNLESYLDAKQIKKAIFIGYSLGGRIALYFKQFCPQRVMKCICISSHVGLESASEKKKRFDWDMNWYKKMENFSFDVFLDHWYKQALFKTLRDNKNFKSMLEKRRKNNPQKLKKVLLGFSLSKQPFFGKNIDSSTYFICGEEDEKFVNLYTSLNLPFKKITGCSHSVHTEKPYELANLIKKILED